MNEAPTPAPGTPPKKNHAWIYFFAFLLIASVGVTGFMIWYNLSIQLKPGQLDEAEKHWRESNIKNYNMVYRNRLNFDDQWTTFAAKVRDGKVVEVLMNGKPLEKDKEEDQDPRPYHSMDAHFRFLARSMELDQKPNAPKVYFIADFDPQTGAIQRYTRYEPQTKQRVEMQFTLEAVEK